MSHTTTLKRASRRWHQRRDDTQQARDALAQAVRDAIADGMSEAEAARITGVTRMTIRAWIGK